MEQQAMEKITMKNKKFKKVFLFIIFLYFIGLFNIYAGFYAMNEISPFNFILGFIDIIAGSILLFQWYKGYDYI